MNLNYHDWSLSLDLNGGRIKELNHKGIKVFGTYQRIDGKTGNTHLCIPSFDKEGQIYDLPFHGLVRTIQWVVKSESKTSIIISSKTHPSPLYPAALYVEQEFDLENNFIHKIRVTHIEGKRVPLNISCHYYWDTPKGWKNSMLNGLSLAPKIESNGYGNLKKINSIIFPHATYQMSVTMLRSVVLWTGFKMDNAGNKLFSNDFCCIEPVIEWPHYFGTEKSILRPGEIVSSSVEIKKVE